MRRFSRKYQTYTFIANGQLLTIRVAQQIKYLKSSNKNVLSNYFHNDFHNDYTFLKILGSYR
jgi:hypothetical protein